jgi:hypothetical protein
MLVAKAFTWMCPPPTPMGPPTPTAEVHRYFWKGLPIRLLIAVSQRRSPIVPVTTSIMSEEPYVVGPHNPKRGEDYKVRMGITLLGPHAEQVEHLADTDFDAQDVRFRE